MSAVDELLQQIPLSQVAQQVGADEATTESAIRGLVPQLIGTMQANAQDPAGEQSLAGALNDHAGRGLLDGGLDINQVDTADGAAITQHLFGADPQQAAMQLSGAPQLGGIPSGLIQKLLPILAPIVLAYLGRQLGGGGGLGNILGSILGGGGLGGLGGGFGQPQQTQQPSGGGLSDILGQILGGGGGFGQPQTADSGFGQQQGSVFGGGSDSPFNPTPVNNDGPVLDAGQDAQRQQQQQAGGGLMDVLKDVFGGKDNRS